MEDRLEHVLRMIAHAEKVRLAEAEFDEHCWRFWRWIQTAELRDQTREETSNTNDR